MIQIAKKNRIFCHFIGASDRNMNACFGRTKWCVLFGHRTTGAGLFKNQRNAFLNDPNSLKHPIIHAGSFKIHRNT